MTNRTIYKESYAELRAAAVAPGATAADIDTLGAWFEQYGASYWNGESYNMGGGLALVPVIAWDEERDQGDVIGWKIV